MAGQPIYHAYLQSLRDGGPDLEERIFTRFIEGKESIGALAVHFSVNLRALYKWLHEDPERWARWQKAKEFRAEAMAEGTLDIAEDAPETAEGVRKAELRVKVRQWLAACNFPERYGKQAKVEISVNQLHLEALREINAEDTKRRLAAVPDPAETVIADPIFADESAPAPAEDPVFG